MTVQPFFGLANIRLSFLVFASFFSTEEMIAWVHKMFVALASDPSYGGTRREWGARGEASFDWTDNKTSPTLLSLDWYKVTYIFII